MPRVHAQRKDRERGRIDARFDVALDVRAALVGRAVDDQLVHHFVRNRRDRGLAIALLGLLFVLARRRTRRWLALGFMLSALIFCILAIFSGSFP